MILYSQCNSCLSIHFNFGVREGVNRTIIKLPNVIKEKL